MTKWPDIERLLPHRKPFLLIDKVIDYKKGFLIASKWVDRSDSYFEGHFPSNPIVPGVILIEIMTQACGALNRLDRSSKDADIQPRPGKLAKIDNAVFHKEVYPDTALLIESKIILRIGKLCKFEANIKTDNELISKSSIVISSPY